MSPVRVLSVASEIYPVVKTGGLADVAGALPAALQGEGIETRTIVPGYPVVMKALTEASEAICHTHFFGGPARLLSGASGELDLFVLDAPHLFARPGNPYLSADGVDWPDNGIRFAALSRMAADISLGAIPEFVPDIVHAHDWQAGLTHAYLHYSGRQRPGAVMTVHNLAYQGQFPREMLGAIGLPPESFAINGVEYYGAIGYLKAGLQFADRITTVSPTYAREIQEDEAGMGLGGLLRARAADLSGILNGIDTAVWDPSADPNIASPFGAGDVQRRPANKAALQRRLGLKPLPDAMLIGVISRLSWQKGLDLLLEAVPTILGEGMQLALLGSGDHDLQARFAAAARADPARIGVVIGYDEALAHLIQAGSDALAVPSRFEPCGLTQLCALRYGSVPIVSNVGGLADTLIDADEGSPETATGFKLAAVTGGGLSGALGRAHVVFHDKPAWRQLQQNGMSTDVSWRSRAGRYAELYRTLVETRYGQAARATA
jgi:starch synthase